jgi:hypothetical protein
MPNTFRTSSRWAAGQVHPRCLEGGLHRAAGAQLGSFGVGLGHVDEYLGARPRGGQEAGQERVGDLGVVGEQRTDLHARPAGAQHAVAGDPPAVQTHERVSRGPVDPGPQKALPLAPEDAAVEGEQIVERHRGNLDEVVGAVAAARRAPADVAVREHEAAALVVALLLDDSVHPDDAPARPRERTLEKRRPDAAAT